MNQKNDDKAKNRKYFILLHILILLMSVTGILSKLAAQESNITFRFIAFYLCELIILGVYALGWQQVIKHIPLTLAFTSKSVGIIWSALWGILLFGESINAWKLLGMALVMLGTVLYAAEGETEDEH